MAKWFQRKHRSRVRMCTTCGNAPARSSGLCRECEREEQRTEMDARRGFSIDWAECVRTPWMSVPGWPRDDGGGGAAQE
jgi:ketopantoate reductase